MDRPIENYWQIRLTAVKEALEANNFEIFVAANRDEAKRIVLEEIVPKTGAKSCSWGGSMTITAVGICEALKNTQAMNVIDTFERNLPAEEVLERRRQSLLVDLFITGTNAVTETGQLVNLDMIGNRIGGITFGPRQVIILVGRNKVVADLEEAMYRIKSYTAPANAMRLDRKTPCVKTSRCEECNSPERICNTWTITEKSWPKGRVKIVLINEDLGL